MQFPTIVFYIALMFVHKKAQQRVTHVVLPVIVGVIVLIGGGVVTGMKLTKFSRDG